MMSAFKNLRSVHPSVTACLVLGRGQPKPIPAAKGATGTEHTGRNIQVVRVTRTKGILPAITHLFCHKHLHNVCQFVVPDYIIPASALSPTVWALQLQSRPQTLYAAVTKTVPAR